MLFPELNKFHSKLADPGLEERTGEPGNGFIHIRNEVNHVEDILQCSEKPGLLTRGVINAIHKQLAGSKRSLGFRRIADSDTEIVVDIVKKTNLLPKHAIQLG